MTSGGAGNVHYFLARTAFTNRNHNEANGEGGNDGCNSWNYGFEGETGDAHIKSLRGTPMMLMGDEYRHTRYGNNNSYGHDTALNNFHWKEASLNILLLLLILP
ncbi:hypothetical protein DY000_02051441 [Brassica cretica]|uniref:Uncharacterized protein n=1 Tax=Brassica cretica TaxID=69181 RepID=A0ABQ7F0X8_BRACR|nr:hypothetical protein DY000_02051441 [Brassica cretica]